MMNLSKAAQRLWAKKSSSGEPYWLPLITHLEDTAALAEYVWNRWASSGTRRVIAQGCSCGEAEALKLFTFILASHDVGKGLPVFQSKPAYFGAIDTDERIYEELICAGLPMKPYKEFAHPRQSLHALASQVILENAGCNRNVAAIAGAHHGRPPSSFEINNGDEYAQESNYCVNNAGKKAWDTVRAEIIEYALELSGYKGFDEIPAPNIVAQMLLSGLSIMVDWIASNERFYPYIGLDEDIILGAGKARAEAAKPSLGFLKTVWQPDGLCDVTELFNKRFGFKPRPMQKDAVETARGIVDPGIFVLEAPMGIGKTEVALMASETFASVLGCSGVFFALPTQATSDGIFPRLLSYLRSLDGGAHSIELVHGKAQFNDDFRLLEHTDGGNGIAQDDEAGAVVFSWFNGRKKALLADFVVGTIDQLLLLALKQKHVMLRHIALSNKVVVIDECHAFDVYMNVYLKRALNWLGRYKVPVIMLSATLPNAKRNELIGAYLGKEQQKLECEMTPGSATDAYPVITYSDGDKIYSKAVKSSQKQVSVALKRIADEDIIGILDELLSNGGCAGIIVNTVARAQALMKVLSEHFGGDVMFLIHSRFVSSDRLSKERCLRGELGKPGNGVRRPYKRIVIGTQVIEQSLDLDFDVMITDLCPVDLLLQRIGRLHRHNRTRPKRLCEPCCYVLGALSDSFERGSVAVYGEYTLMRTRALLPEKITLPDNVSQLVQTVYDGERDTLPLVPNGYDSAEEEWKMQKAINEKKAKTFRIAMPSMDAQNTLEGFLDVPTDGIYGASDAAGEAAVRDAADSIEVVAVMRNADNKLCCLSGEHVLPESI